MPSNTKLIYISSETLLEIITLSLCVVLPRILGSNIATSYDGFMTHSTLSPFFRLNFSFRSKELLGSCSIVSEKIISYREMEIFVLNSSEFSAETLESAVLCRHSERPARCDWLRGGTMFLIEKDPFFLPRTHIFVAWRRSTWMTNSRSAYWLGGRAMTHDMARHNA